MVNEVLRFLPQNEKRAHSLFCLQPNLAVYVARFVGHLIITTSIFYPHYLNNQLAVMSVN